jgi:hypothetical protein
MSYWFKVLNPNVNIPQTETQPLFYFGGSQVPLNLQLHPPTRLHKMSPHIPLGHGFLTRNKMHLRRKMKIHR